MWKKIGYSPFMRLVAGVVMVLYIMVAVEFVVNHIFVSFLPDQSLRSVIVSVVTIAYVLWAYVLLYATYEKRKVSELSLTDFSKQMGTGLLTGFMILTLVVGVIYLAGGYKITAVNFGSFLLSGFLLCLFPGVTEEVICRGIIFRLVEEKLGTWISLLLSAFLFGFLHAWNPGATTMSSIALSLEAGVLLAAAYVYTRNLWFPIFIHIAWNFTGAYVYGVIISGLDFGQSLFKSEVSGSEWITGGAFGPENSIQAIVVGGLLGIVFLYLAWRKGNIIPPYWMKQKNRDIAVVENHVSDITE